MKQKLADKVDVQIGRRVRAYRLSRRLTQEMLGTKLGVTFQQIQKYERGLNRIGGGRLKKVANILGVPVAALFGDESDAKGTTIDRLLTDFLSQPYAARLVQGFSYIKDNRQRQAVVTLVESMGRMPSEGHRPAVRNPT